MVRKLIAIAPTLTLFHLLFASLSVHFVKDSVTLDLTKILDGVSNIREWIVETQEDRIFLLTIQSASEGPLDHEFIESILTIRDGHDEEASILFPESASEKLFPMYSTGNSVLIRVNYELLSNMALQTLQLKMEKAVSCPVSLPGPSSCGRIVDPLSCYCATFSNRNWEETKAYCRNYGMQFLALESYEEDRAVWSTWGGTQSFWIGAFDPNTTADAVFIWDATRELVSLGYTNWSPGSPAISNENCVHYLPDGARNDCTGTLPSDCIRGFFDKNLGGICELQP